MLPLLLLLQAAAAAPTTNLQVSLSEENGTCTIAMGGKTYILPWIRPHSAEQQALEAALADLARRKASVHIVQFDTNKVAYRCMGGFIYLAQMAGVTVGFVSEPPRK